MASRKELILDYMRGTSGFVTVEQLCEQLFVSGATVRRDLTALEAAGLIRRTRGGAILIEGSTTDDPLAMRETQNAVKKQIIANEAARHIRDGMTLFLDSSSTVFTLARKLEGFQKLNVITNGLKTALFLSDLKNVTVQCTGGAVRENTKSLVGNSTVEFISRFTADAAFMSCRGFSLGIGASEASEEEYYIKKQFIANSKSAFLLVDTSKIEKDYSCRIGSLSLFDRVITERADINSHYNERHT